MSFLQSLAAAFKGGAARVPLARAFVSPWYAADASAYDYPSAVKRAYLGNPVAQRAVRLVAEGIAGAPLAPGDAGLASLVTATSAGQSLLETLASHLLLHGNAYVQVMKDARGRPAELFALRPERIAAVSAATPNWRGAALYVDQGDGQFQPLGPSGRTRSVLGAAETTLTPANPLLFDRSGGVTVALVDPAMTLADATGRQLALGANRALLGEEIVPFGRAEPLGGGRWRLSQLLRGRGGTEAAAAGHAAGERFVLLDARPVALNPVGAPGAEIAAVGLGDDEPVVAPISLRGITQRPLSPVHPRAQTLTDGTLDLAWTRRARGAWGWPDGVDAPLAEQTKRYLVTLGDPAAPDALWEIAEPRLALSPAVLSALPAGPLAVRQQGSHALSQPLFLHTLD